MLVISLVQKIFGKTEKKSSSVRGLDSKTAIRPQLAAVSTSTTLSVSTTSNTSPDHKEDIQSSSLERDILEFNRELATMLNDNYKNVIDNRDRNRNRLGNGNSLPPRDFKLRSLSQEDKNKLLRVKVAN
jgi:hypothetical protein